MESLKQMIEKMCKIPASSQVLLVSGGEVLRSDARVCKYSAGTDTNPIYMFSKTFTPYEPVVSIGDYSTGRNCNFITKLLTYYNDRSIFRCRS